MPVQSTRKIAPIRPVEPRACETCGTVFKPRSNVQPGRFCSPACANAGKTRAPSKDRFLHSLAIRDDPKSCWEWQRGRTGEGYGAFHAEGRQIKAHRYAWEIVAGVIPDGLQVLHTCDNPACCRNDDEGVYWANGAFHPRYGHLWLGTNADNMEDKVAKGRQAIGQTHGAATHPESTPHGERNWHAKLTEDDVRTIRLTPANDLAAIRVLAQHHDVHPTTISNIIKRKTWRHLD